jgi:hypothetical protein
MTVGNASVCHIFRREAKRELFQQPAVVLVEGLGVERRRQLRPVGESTARGCGSTR